MKRIITVVAAAAVVALVGAGAGYAGGQITGAQIASNTVTSKNIKDGTIKTKDIKPGTVKRLKGQQGLTGPTGPQGPAGSGFVKVSTLTGQFGVSNPSVSLTPDGVAYGPYVDGGAAGGSVCWTGMNGKPLSAIKSLSYVERHLVDSPVSFEGYAAPYLRVFLNADNDDVVFSPNTQNTVFAEQDVDAGEFNLLVPTSGSARYDDDAENTVPDLTWAAVETAHASEVIGNRGICVSQGFSAGANVSGLLRSLEVNGTTYQFEG